MIKYVNENLVYEISCNNENEKQIEQILERVELFDEEIDLNELLKYADSIKIAIFDKLDEPVLDKEEMVIDEKLIEEMIDLFFERS